jgi:ubiquinone/menaquinone biosynthesis C-methylase UbiE
MKESEKRATMPKGTNSVLDRRTLVNSNRNLLSLVKKGFDVLDVGCGSGTITRDIIDLVGSNGSVKGIDTSEHLVGQAQGNFSNIKNLDFEVADINNYSANKKFDLITSARVLQWLSNPGEVLMKMKDLLKDGGCLTILDYNHTKIMFEPALPSSMIHLYGSFLKWRKDSGMDNEIADHLADFFKQVKLKNITVEDQSEISILNDPSFHDEISIWKKVAETRGLQLVNDNYITEDARLLAIKEYQDWMEHSAKYMKLYIKSVTGFK